MGLFRKTLDDMKEFIHDGDFDKAKNVLDEHISAEHNFQSDLSNIAGSAAAFQQMLRRLSVTVDHFSKDPDSCSDHGKSQLIDMVDSAEDQLFDLLKATKKLLKEEKSALD